MCGLILTAVSKIMCGLTLTAVSNIVCGLTLTAVCNIMCGLIPTGVTEGHVYYIQKKTTFSGSCHALLSTAWRCQCRKYSLINTMFS